MVKDQMKWKLSAKVVGKNLGRYRMIATFKKNGCMKLMTHTREYMAQLLTSEVALMIKTVTTMRVKYIKRRMYKQ